MNSKHLSLITATVLAVIGIFGAATAQANTYCAKLNPGDLPGATCDGTHSTASSAVQDAVEDAKDNPGPDTVLIGPGNFTSPSGMDLYGSSTSTDNTVTIIGSGSGTDPVSSTILSVSNQAVPTITFDAGAGSSISDLSFFINASSTPGGREGLVLRNSFEGEPPTATNLNIYSNPNAYLSGGVVLYSGSDIDNSSIDLASSTFTLAVKVDGQGSQISRSYVAGSTGVMQGSNNGELSVNRTEIQGTSYGITNSSGFLSVNDSLIELSSGNAQAAVVNEGGNAVAGDALFNGSTIIAKAGAGIRIAASQGTSSSNLYFDNSVLAGAAGNIVLQATNPGDSVSFGSDSGAYDSTLLSSSGSGTISVEPVDVVDLNTSQPGFVDEDNGNYRLAAGSALIDTGQDIDPPEGALDYQGYPRACHGTASGLIRRDIGAFEFKTDPNDDCTYPEATIGVPSGAPADSTRTFPLTSTKANSTFECSIDGSPFQTCPAPFTTPTLPAGDHTLAVKARDSFGNLQQTPVSTSFTIEPATCETDPDLCPPPTCETDPSLCPKPDRTAPKVIGLKAPKKTKANRVKVRFRSNEAGARFRCKLNGAKWRTCKSPWKTPKLKKGKNVIRIQATDKAGNKSKVVKRTINRKVRRN